MKSEFFPSGRKARGECINYLSSKLDMCLGGGYVKCGSADQPVSPAHEVMRRWMLVHMPDDEPDPSNTTAVPPSYRLRCKI